jgi:hypothetical protein
VLFSPVRTDLKTPTMINIEEKEMFAGRYGLPKFEGD